jgi:hypothetical protein
MLVYAVKRLMPVPTTITENPAVPTFDFGTWQYLSQDQVISHTDFGRPQPVSYQKWLSSLRDREFRS